MQVLISYMDDDKVIRMLTDTESKELIDENGVYSEECLNICADLGIDPESITSYDIME